MTEYKLWQLLAVGQISLSGYDKLSEQLKQNELKKEKKFSKYTDSLDKVNTAGYSKKIRRRID